MVLQERTVGRGPLGSLVPPGPPVPLVKTVTRVRLEDQARRAARGTRERGDLQDL